jgi:hypothetical protein
MSSESRSGLCVNLVHQLNLTKMKKILFALIMGFTFIAAPSNCAYAQNSKKAIESNFKKNYMPSIRNLATLENPDLSGAYILNRNEINIWAVRDFLDRFDKIENVFWFSGPKGGYEAYFVQDGYGDRVIYDKKGGWQSSLINYDEDKLPRDIRAEVKSTYFDFDIILVEEVHTIEGIEYIVYLEDKSNIRLVKVNKQGEMQVLQDLNK